MSDSDFDVSLGENDMQEGPSAAIIPSSVGSAMVSQRSPSIRESDDYTDQMGQKYQRQNSLVAPLSLGASPAIPKGFNKSQDLGFEQYYQKRKQQINIPRSPKHKNQLEEIEEPQQRVRSATFQKAQSTENSQRQLNHTIQEDHSNNEHSIGNNESQDFAQKLYEKLSESVQNKSDDQIEQKSYVTFPQFDTQPKSCQDSIYLEERTPRNLAQSIQPKDSKTDWNFYQSARSSLLINYEDNDSSLIQRNSLFNSSIVLDTVDSNKKFSPSIAGIMRKRSKMRYNKSDQKFLKNIPRLTKDTVNKNTYDIDFLLDPKTQKQSEQKHRFVQQLKLIDDDVEKKEIKKKKNYMWKNIQNLQTFQRLPDSPERQVPQHSVVKIKKRRPDKFDTQDRNKEYYMHVQEKNEKLAKQLRDKEMEECTFHPKISDFSGERGWEQFFYEMEKFQRHKNEDMKFLREERDREIQKIEKTRAPKLNQKTLDIVASQQREMPIHEALYQNTRKYKLEMISKKYQNGDDQLTPYQKYVMGMEQSFIPEISARAKRIQRSRSVDKLLYEDAMRRLQWKRTMEPEIENSQFKASKASNQIINQKFIKQFEQAWELACGQEDKIKYSQLSELMKQLGFIVDNSIDERMMMLKMWKQLDPMGTQQITQKDVRFFLLSVLNYPVEQEIMSMVGSHQDSFEFGQEYKQMLKQSRRIHDEFRKFQENKVENIKLERSQKSQQMQEHSFMPTINKNTHQWLKNRESFENRLKSYILNHRQNQLQKREMLKKQQEEDYLSQFSFRPNTTRIPSTSRSISLDLSNQGMSSDYRKILDTSTSTHRSDSLYRLGAIQKQRRYENARSKDDTDLEKSLISCSFHPDISFSQKTHKSMSSLLAQPTKITGYQSFIDRTVQAREQRERLQNFLQRGGTLNSKSYGMIFGSQSHNRFQSAFGDTYRYDLNLIKQKKYQDKSAERLSRKQSSDNLSTPRGFNPTSRQFYDKDNPQSYGRISSKKPQIVELKVRDKGKRRKTIVKKPAKKTPKPKKIQLSLSQIDWPNTLPHSASLNIKQIPWIDHSPTHSFLTMENIEWFSEPEEEEEVPIVVSVNIAPGKMDDLVLRPGENLEEIVKLFVAKHCLNPMQEDRIMQELSAAVESDDDEN